MLKLSLFVVLNEHLFGLSLLVSNRSPDERIFGGPRFGRSGGAGAVILSNGELDRNPERFFIGSRYGKRSSETTERRKT